MKNSKIRLLYKIIQESSLEIAIFSICIYMSPYRLFSVLASCLYFLLKYHQMMYMLVFPLLIFPCLIQIPIQLNHLTLIEKREASSLMLDSFGQTVLVRKTVEDPLGSSYSIKGKIEKIDRKDFFSLPFQTQRPSLKPKVIKRLQKGQGYLAYFEKRIKEVPLPYQRFFQSILLGYYQKGCFHGFAWIGFVKLLSSFFRYRLDNIQRKGMEMGLYSLILGFLTYHPLLVLYLFRHLISFLKWERSDQYGLLLYGSLLLFHQELLSLGILVSLFYQSEFLWRLKKKEAFCLRLLWSMYVFGSFRIELSIGFSFFRKVQAFMYLSCLFYLWTKLPIFLGLIQLYIKQSLFLESFRIGYSFSWLWWIFIFLALSMKRKLIYLGICLFLMMMNTYLYRQVLVLSLQGLPLMVLQEGRKIRVIHAGQQLDSFLENYQKKFPFQDYVLVDGRKKVFEIRCQKETFLWNLSENVSGYQSRYLILSQTKDLIKKMDQSGAKMILFPRSLTISQERFLKENHKAYFCLEEEKGLQFLFWKFGTQIRTGKGNFVIMKADESRVFDQWR